MIKMKQSPPTTKNDRLRPESMVQSIESIQ